MANGVASSGAAGEWLSCSEDKTVALVDWAAGRVVETWRGHEKGVHRVTAAPSGDIILSGSRDTTVRLWRRGQEEAAATLRGHELSVTAVAAAADGRSALSGSRDYSLRLWDLASGKSSGRCQISRNVVTCLSWVPGEASLVAQGSEDLRLRLWDVRTLSKPAATLEGYVFFPLCCDAAGPYVLTGSNGFNSEGCELRLWDRRTNACVHVMSGHEQAVTGTALLTAAGGGERLLCASGCKDGSMRLWDAASAGCVARGHLGGGDGGDGVGGGITGVAAALPAETEAQLYVSATSGHVHAVHADLDAAALRVVASGGPGG